MMMAPDVLIAKYEKLLGQRPDDELIHFSLGKALYDADRFSEAETHLGLALSAKPDWMVVAMLLARCALHRADIDTGRALYERALEMAIAQKHEGPEEEIRSALAKLNSYPVDKGRIPDQVSGGFSSLDVMNPPSILLLLLAFSVAPLDGATNTPEAPDAVPTSNGKAESAPNAVPGSGNAKKPALAPTAPPSPAPANLGTKSASGAAVPSGANGVTAAGTPVTSSPPSSSLALKNLSATNTSAPLTLDSYIGALAEELKLSDEQKKEVQSFYLADGTELQTVLNDETLSPLAQEQKVSDLRDARNEKIEALLQGDPVQQRDFLKIEAGYRVALVELAADSGMTPAQPMPPSPAPTQLAPGEVDQVPNAKGLAK